MDPRELLQTLRGEPVAAEKSKTMEVIEKVAALDEALQEESGVSFDDLTEEQAAAVLEEAGVDLDDVDADEVAAVLEEAGVETGEGEDLEKDAALEQAFQTGYAYGLGWTTALEKNAGMMGNLAKKGKGFLFGKGPKGGPSFLSGALAAKGNAKKGIAGMDQMGLGKRLARRLLKTKKGQGAEYSKKKIAALLALSGAGAAAGGYAAGKQ